MFQSQNVQKKPAFIRRLIKFLASLKLAVIVLIAIAAVVAVGTIVESKLDATAAKKLVYDTIWMDVVMGMLAINLTAVMVDRWPWKARHTAFVLAHIGILILMAGSMITKKFGLDGSMHVSIGGSNQYVTVPETDLLVYTSFDGDRYTKLAEMPVDFFLNQPTKEKPLVIKGFDSDIKFVDYKPYVVPSRKVVEPKDHPERHGAGLRFQIHNSTVKVNVIEWLVQRRPQELVTHNFGPASLHLGPAPEKGRGANEIYFTPQSTGDLQYVVFQKDSDKPLKTGRLKEGDVFNPGWRMPIEVRALRYFPRAKEEWDIQVRDYPVDGVTTSAVKLEFNGQDHWMLLNENVKLFSKDVVYIVGYGHRRIDLGFPIKLTKFTVDRYQGTKKAMEYMSHVEVPDLGVQPISMNEPLKYRGLTIYQSSFQEDPNTMEPIASIFSINQDPGRWLKYLGSFVISLGIVMLFYFKKKANKGKTSS